jgi:pilus assembly protein FimV
MRLRPILALSIVLAWLPALGHALGLGEIKLKSGLNQPMVAEIDLLQMRDLGPNEVLPSLASPEDFQRAGVSRDFFLTDMRFEVKIRSDGSAYVLVTTRKPIKEPFVNFLMEVLWPAGRLLREYTLLMDPPVYADKVQEAIEAPAAPKTADPVSNVQRERRPAPRPLPQPTRPEIQEPVTTVRSVTEQRPTARRPAPRPRAPQPVPRPVAVPEPQFEDPSQETYTTQANDALWNIATLLRPSGDVTVQQTMLAIQRKNPDAFVDNNINRLKKNQVLRAPTASEVREMTREQAVAEVVAQERRWREKLAARSSGPSVLEEPAISDKAPSKVYESEARKGNKLVIGGVDKSATQNQKNDPTSGAGDEKTSGTSAGASAEEYQNELDRVQSEKLEAQSRIAELDALLTQNDSIISLQNEQIARLRQRLEELEKQASQGAENETGPNDAKPTIDPVAAGSATGPDTNASEGESFEQWEDDAPDIEQAQDANQPAFYENPIYIGIAVGAVVVAGLMFLVFRRREDDEFDLSDEDLEGFDDEDDDLLDSDTEMDLSELDEDEALAAGNALDDQIGDPSDVISEADIFMAYGRFQEAVKLLESAIDNDPNHPEIFVKLLEVFVETKDAEGFVACESRLMGMPFYDSVSDRVAQLRVEYGADLPEAMGDAAAGSSGGDNDWTLSEMGLDDALSDHDEAVSEDDYGLSPVLDTDSDGELQSLEDLESSLTAGFDDEDSVSDDLDDIHASGGSEDSSGNDLVFESDDDFDPLTLVADLDDALGSDQNAEDDIALHTVDLDFAPPADEAPDGSGELGDLAADLDIAFDGDGSDEGAANIVENDFMADTDEAATKLDLARAYIDMGDRAGARDILDEVVQEGNPEQKEEAKALLQKVG